MSVSFEKQQGGCCAWRYREGGSIAGDKVQMLMEKDHVESCGHCQDFGFWFE